MKKISKTLTIINIIILILVHVIQFSQKATFYSQYILIFIKISTIFVGISSGISTIIEFINKNYTISILNLIITVLALPISFLRNSDYRFLFIPLFISIIVLILQIIHFDKERQNIISIICTLSIIICIIIGIIFALVPIIYGNISFANFEKALPQIKQLNAYEGTKKTDLEGYNLMVDGRRIRIEHKSFDNETAFFDVDGNELFRIKTIFGFTDANNFINYIIKKGKYEIFFAIDQ